ncbi:MAG: Crp/Fnr family transcriptional regulator [Campylobacteraceae bacterium]|nr:Crp/Fnr family transcriptional regulator [Campylobacteraceae bacterium]
MLIKDNIKDIELFSDLNNALIDKLISISSIKRYGKNTILHYEGESSKNILFLLSGFIKIFKVDKFDNEIFLYYVQENSIISELSDLGKEEIYSFSNATFTQNSIILSINYLKFKELFLDNNILSLKLIKIILEKTHILQFVLNRELVFDASAKVAYMLSTDLELVNKLKRQEISFMLHIQPETLSRVLKKLSRNNIILMENSKIKIIDQDNLESIFSGVAV